MLQLVECLENKLNIVERLTSLFDISCKVIISPSAHIYYRYTWLNGHFTSAAGRVPSIEYLTAER